MCSMPYHGDMARTFPNKYAAQCTECGQRVDVGEGLTQANPGSGPKWLTTHKVCPQHAPEALAAPASTHISYPPTDEQATAIKIFACGEDLVLQAGAGAGKTSTLKFLAQHALANGRVGQYLAYNRAIVADVKSSMPGSVSCNTNHSLAYATTGAPLADRLPQDGEGGKGMPRQSNNEVAKILGLKSLSIPGHGKVEGRTLAAGWLASKTLSMVDKFCHSADTEISTKHLDYVEGIDETDDDGSRHFDNNNLLAKHLLPFARKAWQDMTTTTADGGRLRTTHDAYFKQWSLSGPVINKDFILLDEAQDADPVMVEVIKFNRDRGVQVVVVGDEQQVLYEWRGAVNAMAEFEALGAKVAFLSQSFRFGDAVAEVANGLLGRLDARLRIKGFGKVASQVGPVHSPDAILTRSNAGAVSTLIAQLALGRKAHLVGGTGAIVSFAKAALALQNGRSSQHPELGMFASWDAVCQYVEEEEQGADLKLMVKLVNEFGAQAILDALEDSADERATKSPSWDGVVISTAHKSKGLQWSSVQIAGDFKAPRGDGDLSPSELRLAYVAATRAQHELDLTNVPHFLGGGEI